MVFFVLKGGEYALKYLRYKTIQSKCRLSFKKLKYLCKAHDFPLLGI